MTEQSNLTIEEQAARDKADLKLADAVPTKKKWRVGALGTAEYAVAWANSNPAQQAGEAVFSVRADGQVQVFAFF